MVLRVRGTWQVPLDYVVWREKWEQVEQTLITGTENNARGRVTTAVTLDWSRLVAFKIILRLLAMSTLFFLDTKVVHLQRMAYSWKMLTHWVFNLLLQDCQFTKTKDDTALRVVYKGNLYLGGCGNCCKRWFITFNGAECSGPLPIDAVLWIGNTGENNHRPGFIECYYIWQNPNRNQHSKLCRIWKFWWSNRPEFSVSFDHWRSPSLPVTS